MKPEPSLSMHTHTCLYLSVIWLISLDPITPWHQIDLIAFHPKLIYCHKNARYFALLCYIGQQWGNLKPSMEKIGLTVIFDSSLQEQAIRESHHKTTTQSICKKNTRPQRKKSKILRLKSSRTVTLNIRF